MADERRIAQVIGQVETAPVQAALVYQVVGQAELEVVQSAVMYQVMVQVEIGVGGQYLPSGLTLQAV